MAERRSLGAAAQLSPEKMAFIGIHSPRPEPAIQTTPIPDSAPPEEKTVEAVEERSRRPSRRSRSRRQVVAPLPEGDATLLGFANMLVPLTTKLQQTTFAALKRAGLEQKLRGQEPASLQEIVDEAIQEWLRDNGYLN